MHIFAFCITIWPIGYHDIGEVWRQEVDLPNLEQIVDSLMQQIKPFYRLLHGVLRNVLWNRVNKFEPFDRTSTIPAHLMGSCLYLFFFLKIASSFGQFP